MTEEQILEINKQCPENQGIFFEPNGIPYKIKDKVVYMRWEVSGSCGAGYHENDHSHYYTNDRPHFHALDLTVKQLKPEGLTEEQQRLVENLIIECENDEENMDYYGNHENWLVEYISLPVLEALLNGF